MQRSNREYDAKFFGEGKLRSLNECVLSIHKATNHDSLRHRVLSQLTDLIPIHSAAFFIADKAMAKYASCMIVQPIGVELFSNHFEMLIDYASNVRSEHRPLEDGESPVFQVSFDDESAFLGYQTPGPDHMAHSLICEFSLDGTRLGVLALTRTASQGAFSEDDRLTMVLLEPHISYRFNVITESRGVHSILYDPLLDEFNLTQREVEVVSCIAYGMTTLEIAAKLTISPSTAKKHLENIYRKTGVRNRLALMKFAQQYMQ